AAFLIVFNRLSAVFEARIWQVGVMRAMGLRPMDVWLELLVESLLVGAAGVAMGLASGVGLARLMLPVLATTTALASKLTVPSARFVVGWRWPPSAAAPGGLRSRSRRWASGSPSSPGSGWSPTASSSP